MKAIVESDYDGDYNKTEIAFSELIVVSPFLRFDQVSFQYHIDTDTLQPIDCGSQPIAEKCESFRGSLPSIKSTLYDSNIIHFNCAINEEDPTQFTDHSALLEHIPHSSNCVNLRFFSWIFVFVYSFSLCWDFE